MPAFNLQQRLMSVDAASALIRAGRACCVAGDEALLRRLPQGNWVGGTIPYFMTEQGGLCSRSEVFVTDLSGVSVLAQPRVYDPASLSRVCAEGPEHGFTLLLLPAFSGVHEAFAQEAPGYPEMYLRPLVGWVSGVHLDDIGRVAPLVFDGASGRALADAAVALHVAVPPSLTVHVDIVNPFQPQPGPVIEFDRGGFTVADCRIDGRPHNLYDWLLAQRHDTRLPLVADCCGALVNVSIKFMDAAQRRVSFYAPVFAGTAYHLARPVGDYVNAFGETLAAQPLPGQPVFSCNCVLNHAYGELEGRQLPVHGPATFGEIGYQLLNQTLVYLSLLP